MTRRSMPPSFHANLFALAPARSYDPIRCQEPQWPRRPLAIGRRGLPLNPSRSAPGMSSTPSAQSHIRGYRSGGPQSSPSAGGSQVCRRECGDRRAHSENGGIPEGCPARRDGGYVYSPAPLHIVPRAHSHLTSSAAVAAFAFAWGMPPRASPRVAGAGARTPSSRASLSRAGLRSPWASAWAGARPGRSARTPRPPAVSATVKTTILTNAQ